LRKPYPRQPVVRDVELEGNQHADAQPLLDGLATTGSARFFGLWDGVAFEYEVYDPDLLARDLERVERYLVRRGFFEAKVVAARVVHVDEHRVRITIRVSEGPPVITRKISLTGLENVPLELSAAALSDSPLQPRQRFDEDAYESSKQRLLSVLLDGGYAFAKVSGRVEVDIASHTADVEYTVVPGERAVYGPVRVVGLREIPLSRVQDSLGIEAGRPYSQASLSDAQRALLNLGVFSSVQVRSELEKAEGNRVPITVLVDEAELRTLRAGAGFQLDTLRLSSHLTGGWESRNFLGGLRRFSIDAKPGVVLFPTRFGDAAVPDRGLFETHVHAQLRQPAFIEGRTTGFVTTSYNVYPLLYANSNADEGIVGFSEVRASAGVERSFWKHRLTVTPSYNWLLESPVDYSGLTLGRGVPADANLLKNLVISFPELLVSLDLRDDPLQTRSGALFSVGVQRALTLLGSDVSDLRLRPEARFYKPISDSVTLAVRATTGWLFAYDYGESLGAQASELDSGQLAHDQQKLLFRGFFSGGPNSNRGYPLREVGPHGNVGFLSRILDCDELPLPSECNRPLGGLSLWELSSEIRFTLLGPLGGVLFADGSDVARSLKLSFLAPHLSTGFGLRYATPIGPIRFDLGYRVPFAQNLRGEEESEPRPLLGWPIAMHLTLGEAF
jgi:outer membrane protein insertion porin family/translocation and assembly module TamA